MKVIHILASDAEEAAGPSYSVPRLCAGLVRAGAEVELFTVGEPGEETIDGVRRRRFAQSLASAPLLGRMRLSSGMRDALHEAVRDADLLHMHGLWLMPNIYPARAARRGGKALVLSPRGMLGAPALRFSRWKKRLFWALAQGQAARSAALIHATAGSEVEDARAMGLDAPAAVIPNGVDVPPLVRPQPDGVRTVLSLGRVHPKKGLDRLVGAWARLGDEARGWRLRIVGPDELGHAGELHALAASLGLQGVEIEGPLYGADKLAAYRSADLFVLPTLHENFGMTVAESLAAATPVISTHGAPWQGLAREGCGWWVEHGEAPLAEALRQAIAAPPEALAAMGLRGRAWMERDFSWERIGRDMLQAYDWTLGRGPRPATVRP